MSRRARPPVAFGDLRPPPAACEALTGPDSNCPLGRGNNVGSAPGSGRPGAGEGAEHAPGSSGGHRCERLGRRREGTRVSAGIGRTCRSRAREALLTEKSGAGESRAHNAVGHDSASGGAPTRWLWVRFVWVAFFVGTSTTAASVQSSGIRQTNVRSTPR